MNMKVWIVVEECEDRHYAPSPTGEVFTDEAKAKAYVEAVNADPKILLFLDLVEGELILNPHEVQWLKQHEDSHRNAALRLAGMHITNSDILKGE